MYIKSIELDGFKSYQKHVEISPFSPRFNAITGYNGSGKSNVLDAICFVLGITKLDAVRAKHLSELIAHGLTKATVQIRFDNRNKAHSPFGMEQFDEIVVVRTIISNGRTCASSYYLNGHSVVNTRMADFFRGVGLNVNNPHFLIMQGRITTVLNMKPEEILGMVEEAAGTKMYDQKKKEAEKTMYVKESKLKEIDQIFETSIDPRMEKFREDRKNMIEVTRLQKMKDNAKRKADAFEYYQALERAKAEAKHLETAQQKLVKHNESIAVILHDAQKKESEKTELEKLRDNPTKEQEFSEELREAQQYSVACQSELTSITEGLDTMKRKVVLAENSIKTDDKEYKKSEIELKAVNEENAAILNENKTNEERVKLLRDELETITRGTIANEKGEQVSIESAIQDTRSAAAVLETTVKTSRNRRDRTQAQINCLKTKVEGMAAKSVKEKEHFQTLKNEVDRFAAEIQNLGFDAATDSMRRNRSEEITRKLRELKGINDDILERACGGRYALNLIVPPTQQFDIDRQVEGLLVWLVKLKPQFREYHQAVDIALGGLYLNIVVRDQDSARILIESKAFSGRRTLIPVSENSRIRNTTIIEDAVVEEAQRIADGFNETVLRLIDMVEFPDKICNTFKSSLGQILVVQTLPCARAVAFGDGVQTRVLTARGDDVKTTGVMSGGASDKADQHVITALEGIHRQFDEIAVLKEEQRGHVQYLRDVDNLYKQYVVVNTKLQEAERKLAIYQNNMKTSDIGRAETELERLKAEAEEINAKIDDASKELGELKNKLMNLESRKTSDKSDLEKRKTSLNKEIKQLERKLDEKQDVASAATSKILQLQATMGLMENNKKMHEKEKEDALNAIEELKLKLPPAEKKNEEAKSAVDEAKRKIKSVRAEHRTVIDRITAIQKDLTSMRKEEIRLTSLKDDMEAEIVRLAQSETDNKKYAGSLEKKIEWLVDEKVHFNKKGGIYDFEGYSTNKGAAEMKELMDRIEKLERSLCMKNVANLDSCEAKVIDIRNKREKLREDFDILKKTITILDTKKTNELERAHESVNKDFGKIFNCLLPDATAELVPPDGMTVCQGLEVKVAFNGVVKESLNELSGGQRSLVALSLILAMLKFKPAPLYILDEVDAALDLSHTANIGKMIKSHFSDNQFIIVSLKQGMFSNAECLFQTHFADGHSTCTRLTGAALDAARNDAKLAQQADELEEEAVKKAKTPAKKSTKKNLPPVDEMAD